MRHIKRLLHKFIVWYLRRCWGTFHSGPYNKYGEQNNGGRYVVLMDDDTYHHFMTLAVGRSSDEFYQMVWILRDADIYVP